MSASRLFLCLTAMACLGGCVMSVNPLYTDDVLVGEPSLEGTWERVAEKNGKTRRTTLVFTKPTDAPNTPGAYDVQSVEGENSSTWKVHLVKLDDDLYLDVVPTKLTVKPTSQTLFLLPLHMICRVKVSDDALTLQSQPDPGKLLAALKEEHMEHRRDEARIVIMAPTEELQQFVIRHSKEIFGNRDTTYVRKKDAEPLPSP